MKIRGFVVITVAVAIAIAPQLVKTSIGAPGLATPAPKLPVASPAPKPPGHKPPPASQSGG